jgi:hypothetical protein
MRKVIVLAEAAEDIEQARDFYDAQESWNRRLLREIAFSLTLKAWRFITGFTNVALVCYRMLAHRFPFGIYYREAKLETQVIAVLDLRRDPNWIRKELSWRELISQPF